ncbi:MAG: ATP synthase F1 subunit delta [Thermoanaerobaculia bacterium]
MSGSIDERQLAVARVYAQALLGLADRQGEVDEILEQLEQLSSLMDQAPALENFLGSPLVQEESRKAELEKLFRGRASDLLVDTLQVMNRKGRLGLIRALVVAYRAEYEELKGRIDVRVTTAVPLSASLRQRLRVVTSEVTGKEAQLVEKVDQSILGGMILRIGDRKIDTSIAKEIRQLNEQMVERASRELYGGI